MDLYSWYKKHQKAVESNFLELLRFPSISTEAEYTPKVRECAHYVADYFKESGFKAEIIESSSHPLVFVEDLSAGKDKPTILIYNHYDVQPVDPIEEWNSPPFEPKVEGKRVFARGAQDNKGQLAYVMAAMRALKEIHKELPVNIKLIIEGEEEGGSVALEKALPELQEKLKADYLLVVDMDIPEIDQPAVTLGCRGLYAASFDLIGSSIDLHSGQHGGMAYNPLRALTQMLAALWDDDGYVRVPHFYDGIIELSNEEKKEIDLSFDENAYKNGSGVSSLWKEKGFNPQESNWIRPTIEINGMWGGYIQEGFKTVIPAKASAKISCRLVPDQDPVEVGKRVKEFFQKNTPEGMKLIWHEHGGGFASRGSLSSPMIASAKKAYEEVFKKPCKTILSGGSVPVIAKLQKATGSDLLLMGVGHSSDHIHAPNESFDLDRLEKGFYVIGKVIETFKG